MSEWGMWEEEPPCEHLLALRRYLEETGLEIYAEHTTNPAGWVNVACSLCQRTYEVTLAEPFATEDEEEEDGDA